MYTFLQHIYIFSTYIYIYTFFYYNYTLSLYKCFVILLLVPENVFLLCFVKNINK